MLITRPFSAQHSLPSIEISGVTVVGIGRLAAALSPFRRARRRPTGFRNPVTPSPIATSPFAALSSTRACTPTSLTRLPRRLRLTTVMHKVTGICEPAGPAAGFDDVADRKAANRAVGVSAVGLAFTGLVELFIALVTGSVGLLGDALHNLSDVSTSAVVFLGFRLSRRSPSERYPYGWERAEDVAGLGVALVIWASAVFAGYQSVHKLLSNEGTTHVGVGMAAAVLGIVGNQVVARYKLRIGRRIQSATLISDAQHSWLDALSSAGALAGLIGVALGWRWADPVAGLLVTVFICHVGYEVTHQIVHRLLDGVDDGVLVAAEQAAGAVAGVVHVHARARWTGRTLRFEIEGWVNGTLPVLETDQLGLRVAEAVHAAVEEARLVTFIPRAMPVTVH